MRRTFFLLALFAACPGVLAGQSGPILQVQAVATATGSAFVGGGAGIGKRLTGRLDLLGSATLGASKRDADLRLEMVTVFHLNFVSQRGWGLYGGGGLAVETQTAGGGRYMLVLIGLEPRSRRGPFLEVGLGGGLRFSAGIRLTPTP